VRVEDAHFEEGRILFRDRRGRPDRYARIPAELRYPLEREAHKKNPGESLFSLRRSRDGKCSPVSPRTLQQYLTKAAESLGLGRVTVQNLRDNYALHLLRRGVESGLIVRLMGYRNSRSVQRFKRFIDESDVVVPSPLED